MITFTPRFKAVVIGACFVAAYGALAYNQYFLQKELTAQSKFDVSVMKEDQKVWAEVQKVASSEAKVTPKVTVTPTPKLLGKSSLTK